MNAIVGQKIAITSRKPQTTRNQVMAVYDDARGQIVFHDTPGIHKAENLLGEYMEHVAEKALGDVDLVLWLVEPTDYIGAGEQRIIEILKHSKKKKILVIHKIDTMKNPEKLDEIIAQYTSKVEFQEVVQVFRIPEKGHRGAQGLYFPVFTGGTALL
jgi:GTP-binding protein Era